MATQYTKTSVPDPGLYLKKDKRGRLWVMRVDVAAVTEIEQVRLPGRTIYRTPDGETFSSAVKALEHLTARGAV